MKDKIKLGEYIKLKRGDIFKIDENTANYYNSNKEFITNEIVKHSKNIIDIIEVGDYVNGEKVNKNKYGELYIGSEHIYHIQGFVVEYDNGERQIDFINEQQEVKIWNISTTMQELQAINEKVKELGWYE